MSQMIFSIALVLSALVFLVAVVWALERNEKINEEESSDEETPDA